MKKVILSILVIAISGISYQLTHTNLSRINNDLRSIIKVAFADDNENPYGEINHDDCWPGECTYCDGFRNADELWEEGSYRCSCGVDVTMCVSGSGGCDVSCQELCEDVCS